MNSKFGYNKAQNIEDTSGYKWSDESRKKLSLSKKGVKMHPNTKNALINANKNRMYKKGFSQKREGVLKSAKSRQIPILQYSLDGKFIREWESAKDAANVFHVSDSQISLCCSGNRFQAGGYQWFKKPINGAYPLTINAYKRCSKNKSITEFLRLCSVMNIEKQGELLENPTCIYKKEDNQQPSLSSNTLEGSTTNNRILPDNAEDSNVDTSALPLVILHNFVINENGEIVKVY